MRRFIACMFNNEGIILSLFKVMMKHIFSHRNSTWRRYSFTLNDNISRKYHWIQWCGIVKHLMYMLNVAFARIDHFKNYAYHLFNISFKCLGKRKENNNKIKFQKKLRQNFYFSLVLSAECWRMHVCCAKSRLRHAMKVFFFNVFFFLSLFIIDFKTLSNTMQSNWLRVHASFYKNFVIAMNEFEEPGLKVVKKAS